MPSKNIKQEEKDSMVISYLSGKTAKESAEPFGLSYMACLSELKRRGIPIRVKSDYKKYEVDESIFEEIDTEESAYWLGFIAADGYVSGGNLAIRLCERDVGHLEKFRKFIQSTHPVNKYNAKIKGKEHPSCSIFIYSKKIINDLAKLNIVENKTRSFEVPRIPVELLKHFWRGFFDGDGSISSSTDPKRGRNVEKFNISITGNRLVVECFEKYVKSLLSTKSDSKNVKGTENYYFRVSGNNSVKTILSEIYNNPKIYLDRKYEKVQECLSLKGIRRNLDYITLELLNELKDKCKTWNAVASSLNLDRRNLSLIRKRLEKVNV